jgi:arsenite methyltransferase
MTTRQTDQDALREQVRARYAAAATKVTSGDCGCGEGCCGGAATAEEPGFGAELYAAPDRDPHPPRHSRRRLGSRRPRPI